MSIDNLQTQITHYEDDDLILLNEENYPTDESSEQLSKVKPWQIMIVDNEPSVHQATKLALRDYHFRDRPLELLHAYSAIEAIVLIEEHADICLVLLDVVMETKDAGLKVVEHIRDVFCNSHIQIILRTGQPGEFPELDLIQNYEINDYKLIS